MYKVASKPNMYKNSISKIARSDFRKQVVTFRSVSLNYGLSGGQNITDVVEVDTGGQFLNEFVRKHFGYIVLWFRSSRGFRVDLLGSTLVS